MPAQSSLWSIIYSVGLLLVFVGERLIGSGSARSLSAVGVLLVLLALVMRAKRAAGAKDEAKQIEKQILALYGIGALGLLLYFAQSDLMSSLAGGKPIEQSWPRLTGVLGALWPAAISLSLVPVMMAELAYASVARAPKL